MKGFEILFKEEYDKAFALGKKEFLVALERASDPIFVYHEYKEKFDQAYSQFQNKSAPYGYSWIRDIEDIQKRDKRMSREDAIQERFKDVQESQRIDGIKTVALIKAKGDLSNFFYEHFVKHLRPAGNSEIEIQASNHKIQWKGNNNTEFVQLVYALHEAQLLTNEKDEITSLVTQLADLFHFDLSENWQSLFSRAVNDRNYDYEPEIFNKIAKAYNSYCERRKNKN